MSKATKAPSVSARVRSSIGALHLAAIRDDVSMACRALSAEAPLAARAKDTDELYSAELSSISVDEGTLYTFVCTRCKVRASLVQSH